LQAQVRSFSTEKQMFTYSLPNGFATVVFVYFCPNDIQAAHPVSNYIFPYAAAFCKAQP
jgi:hypothetical protein